MSTRPKVFLTRKWPEAAERRLAERYDVTINAGDSPLGPSELAEALATHDAVCPTVSDRLTAEVFRNPGIRARIIGNFGVGYNHIDLDAARAAGLVVTNTPDVLTNSTADIALMLMLMAARRAGEGERELRAGRWSGWRPTHLLGRELSGKILGLVGFGRIARATARRAVLGFGMSVIYFSRTRAEPAVEGLLGARHEPDLHALLGASDFVSLHVPGGSATYNLIDAAALSAMQEGAILVNTARGDVLDHTALGRALRQGRIAAAGLDVYPAEPTVPPDVMAMENVVLLPHLGSATQETRSAMGWRVADNLDAFFDGREPADRVV